MNSLLQVLQSSKTLAQGQRKPVPYYSKEYLDGFRQTSLPCESGAEETSPKSQINFTPIRQNIMESIDNNDCNKICNLLKEFCHDNSLEYYPRTLMMLFVHCIQNEDIEILKRIIGSQIFSKEHHELLMATIFGINFTNKKFLEEFFHVILDNNEIVSATGKKFVKWTINCNYSDFSKSSVFKILEEYGYRLTDEQLANSIKRNYIDVLQYAIQNGYDIQKSFDQCTFYDEHYNPNSILSCYVWGLGKSNRTCETIKFLMKNQIDISSKLDDLLLYGAQNNTLDVVELCVELKANEIDKAFKISCNYNYPEIANYLLGNMTKPEIMTNEDLGNAKHEIVILLLKNGIRISPLTLNRIFLDCFVAEDNLSASLELIEYGADPIYIFEQDNCPQPISNISQLSFKQNSKLEFLVMTKKISQLEFLAKNCFSRLEPEIDNLFIIAIANGHIPLANYLLDIGANYDTCNSTALTVACFIGHMSSVQFLLEKGIELAGTTENLLMITAQGHKTLYGIDSNYYSKLTDGNNIFRNDQFIFGRDHLEIFRLCMKQQVPFPGNSILEVLPKEFYEEDIFSYLISNGIDFNQSIPIDTSEIITYLRLKPTNLDQYCTIDNQYTILELGIIYNKYQIVRMLLENGVSLNANNHHVIELVTKLGFDDMINLLKEYEINS